MISNSDFEKAWFLYKTEYEPQNISINDFCFRKGLPYKEFNKWFRNTHKQVVPLEVEGAPDDQAEKPVVDDGMETVEELKKYVRFLYELNQEKDKRILRMESDMSEIKNDLKEANRRADEEAASRQRLFDKLERFMDGKKSESDKFKELERKYETLQGRYDLLCAAYYGGSKTCSDKYSGQKNEGINE